MVDLKVLKEAEEEEEERGGGGWGSLYIEYFKIFSFN